MNGVTKNNENVTLNGYNAINICVVMCAYALKKFFSVMEISQLEIQTVDSIGKREQRVF